ncbi:TPA: rRNA maturation RNase YbeY [candidate division CPR2 bacterium]|uniref:Endoribonuclease YbeY n=1 Tax=candidate division CPR2 bacterium GW2011_GWC1_41_48 TaxID=1618344 RepID=A0A0G0Z9F2_UNCC2|nr:MAG: putative rRNA maturation factor [candidate division CPR2 bacterium GW2011_GWC2_39_35]KKR29498.1 MAG: putative rRNA maturation factor [candidate division CPR2 bacterium GW2011_GWD2_39_7]KKR29723.1 MAG: putative rRNA maturation factor [candidate division CPR2 bacterium GW2011_GWD1_39_7]KKS09653.1 MAG: Endoribonuclease YbeY [candidate division CPR2 bacterium GW2011_GWC1_41_48]OGB71725.1 MAG: rRNA maturation RNase YbeY [candidate division CPR2 bacterium GWD2_39_7]HBG81448.1 rRNA maturation
MINFIIYNLPEGLSEAFIQNVANQISKTLNKSDIIEVNFISKEEIKHLNKDYRGKNMETDVLSFSFTESRGERIEEKNEVAGQIFICYDIAREQAIEHEWSLENELALLMIHGALHIYGYDHENEQEYMQMVKKENEILKNLKLREYES